MGRADTQNTSRRQISACGADVIADNNIVTVSRSRTPGAELDNPAATGRSADRAVRERVVLRSIDEANRAGPEDGGDGRVGERKLIIAIDSDIPGAVEIDQWAAGRDCAGYGAVPTRQQQERATIRPSGSALSQDCRRSLDRVCDHPNINVALVRTSIDGRKSRLNCCVAGWA